MSDQLDLDPRPPRHASEPIPDNPPPPPRCGASRFATSARCELSAGHTFPQHTGRDRRGDWHTWPATLPERRRT